MFSPKPLIVHNGFMDMSFLMTHFCMDKLPSNHDEYKVLLHETFPVIYDTKVLCAEYSFESRNIQSTLGPMFEKLGPGVADSVSPILLDGEEEGEEQEHEAVYDAFMTGLVFLALVHEIVAGGAATDAHAATFVEEVHEAVKLLGSTESDEARLRFGRNKIYDLSIYTRDLEVRGSDPLSRGMLAESTFRVSGIDKAVNTRDIIQCVGGLQDDKGRQIQFDIVWVDDSTFLVGASFRPQNSEGRTWSMPDEEEMLETIRKQGKHVHEALESRFNKTESITRLDDYLASQKSKAAGRRSGSVLDYLKSLFGYGTKRTSDDNIGDEPRAKRSRTN